MSQTNEDTTTNILNDDALKLLAVINKMGEALKVLESTIQSQSECIQNIVSALDANNNRIDVIQNHLLREHNGN